MKRDKRPRESKMGRAAMTRRDFLTMAGMGGLALAAPGCRTLSAAETARKPNIVLIVADDLGYADLGVQGCRDVPTPNIDSLARNGVRFTNGYVSCPVCSPMRAGLMTGRYQQRFGHEFNPGPPNEANAEFRLPETETLLPERLKALGYATGMFGKWHLGYAPGTQPLDRGFDEFFGFLGGSHSYLESAEQRVHPILRGTEAVADMDYTTDAFAREAAAFIEKHVREPFFVYLPFNAVHGPLQATDRYLARFSDITDKKRRVFAGMLSALDDNVGAVLEKLHETGIEDNTLVIFISDNGGPTLQTSSRNDPLRDYKGKVYEGGIRVPFLVQWKGHIPAGLVYDPPVISLDILPTALAAAGGCMPTDSPLDGVDLVPFLSGAVPGAPHDRLFWRFGEQRAVRMGNWKLVDVGEGAPELYNLAQDIGETNNLAAQQPDKVKELETIYDAWNAQLMLPRWQRRGGAARRRRR